MLEETSVRNAMTPSDRSVIEPLANSRRRTVAGLDIGGSKTAVVEATVDAHILQRMEVPTNAHLPVSQTWPILSDLVGNLIRKASGYAREVMALGVSVGGPLCIDQGLLLDPPHLSGWHNFALGDRLRKDFPNLAIRIEHDGNAGALAEYHFGVGLKRKNLRHLIFLTFGTGLGAGIVVNGEILHGTTDTAGEVGHWRLSENGPVGYGKSGSWEGYTSGKGLVQLATRMFPGRWSGDTPIHELVDAMLADELDALEVAAEAGRWMGRGMALLIDAFNPQVIVLGSLAVVLGERVLATARQIVKAEALSRAAAACEIVPSVLGKSIGDVASLMPVLTDPALRAELNAARQ